MILPLLTFISCEVAVHSELAASCKRHTDLGYPEPRPLRGILGRGRDLDGRFVLKSPIEETFYLCRTDAAREVVVPDGFEVHADVLRDTNVIRFEGETYESHILTQTRNTSAPTSANIPMLDWLFAPVTVSNSTTTETVVPYNISIRQHVVVGKWSYREEAYHLWASSLDIEVNCDFVSDVIRIMEKVELGYDASEEIGEVHAKYGNQVCIRALVGASGSFTHHSTRNSAFENITLMTEPGRIVRSLPCLLGFSLQCIANRAMQPHGFAASIFASTQWLVIWLLGDQYPTPLPTAVFINIGIAMWLCCTVGAVVTAGVLRGRIERPRIGLRWRYIFRTRLLPLGAAALANYAVELQRVRHDPVVHLSDEEFYQNATRCDVGEFTIVTWDDYYARRSRPKLHDENADAELPPSGRRSRRRSASEHGQVAVRKPTNGVITPIGGIPELSLEHKGEIQKYGILRCEGGIGVSDATPLPRSQPRHSGRNGETVDVEHVRRPLSETFVLIGLACSTTSMHSQIIRLQRSMCAASAVGSCWEKDRPINGV